jgi:hypothetical protein
VHCICQNTILYNSIDCTEVIQGWTDHVVRLKCTEDYRRVELEILRYCSAIPLLIAYHVLPFGRSVIMPYATLHLRVSSSPSSSLLLGDAECCEDRSLSPLSHEGLHVSHSPYPSLPHLTMSITLLLGQYSTYCTFTCAAWARALELELDPLHCPCIRSVAL